MSELSQTGFNVQSVAPMLMVTDMERSVNFYVNGLGFTIVNTWTPEGKLRWCWMQLGNAALMLQQLSPGDRDRMGMNPTLGASAALYFQCQDAIQLYRRFAACGIMAREEPIVGNGNWEVFLLDPDGYHINFTSPAEYPEETRLSQVTDR